MCINSEEKLTLEYRPEFVEVQAEVVLDKESDKIGVEEDNPCSSVDRTVDTWERVVDKASAGMLEVDKQVALELVVVVVVVEVELEWAEESDWRTPFVQCHSAGID